MEICYLTCVFVHYVFVVQEGERRVKTDFNKNCGNAALQSHIDEKNLNYNPTLRKISHLSPVSDIS